MRKNIFDENYENSISKSISRGISLFSKHHNWISNNTNNSTMDTLSNQSRFRRSAIQRGAVSDTRMHLNRAAMPRRQSRNRNPLWLRIFNNIWKQTHTKHIRSIRRVAVDCVHCVCSVNQARGALFAITSHMQSKSSPAWRGFCYSRITRALAHLRPARISKCIFLCFCLEHVYNYNVYAWLSVYIRVRLSAALLCNWVAVH